MSWPKKMAKILEAMSRPKKIAKMLEIETMSWLKKMAKMIDAMSWPIEKVAKMLGALSWLIRNETRFSCGKSRFLLKILLFANRVRHFKQDTAHVFFSLTLLLRLSPG